MFKLLITIGTFLLAVAVLCEAACHAADKIKPVKVNFPKLARSRFNVIYGTETIFRSNVSHAYMYFVRTGDNSTVYNSTMIFANKDGKTKEVDYMTEDKHNGILLDTHDNEDEPDSKIVVNSYILGKTYDDVLLLYSCNERDATNGEDDLRFIIAPVGGNITDSSVNWLLKVERTFNFRGSLVRLENEL